MGKYDDPEVMADSNSPVKPEASPNVINMMPQLTGAGNERVLSKEDFDGFDKHINAERSATLMAGEALLDLERIKKICAEAAEKAVVARAERDKFCVSLEEKYNVPKGVRWGFDYAKKAIVINQPRVVHGQTGMTGVQG